MPGFPDHGPPPEEPGEIWVVCAKCDGSGTMEQETAKLGSDGKTMETIIAVVACGDCGGKGQLRA